MNQPSLFGTELPPPKPARAQFSWFFALHPTPAEAQRIYETTNALLAAKGITGKRIDPDRLHVTLEFIGDDVGSETLDAAIAAANSIQVAALDASFDSAYTFPIPSGPLVLAGAEGLDRVRELRQVLASAMKAYGFKCKTRFEPHMTLCYDGKHRLARTRIEPLSFRATELSLVKSHLGKSRHEAVRSWVLKG